MPLLQQERQSDHDQALHDVGQAHKVRASWRCGVLNARPSGWMGHHAVCPSAPLLMKAPALRTAEIKRLAATYVAEHRRDYPDQSDFGTSLTMRLRTSTLDSLRLAAEARGLTIKQVVLLAVQAAGMTVAKIDLATPRSRAPKKTAPPKQSRSSR